MIFPKKKLTLTKSFSYAKLYSFATCLDYYLIIFGMISSALSGVIQPFLQILFGDVTESIIHFAEVVAEFDKTSHERKIAEEKFMDEIMYFTVATCVLGGGVIFFTYLSVLLVNKSAVRQISKIRSSYMHAMLNKDVGWYDVNQTGDFSSRITEDLKKIEDAIGDKSTMFVFFMSTFISSLVMSLIMGWELTLICLLYLPCTTISTAVITWLSSKLVLNEMDAYGKAGAIAEEVFSSIRTVLAFGGQEKEIERYKGYLNLAEKNNIRRALFNGFTNGFMWLFVYGSYALSFWYGVKLIIDERELPVEERIYTPANFIAIFFNILMGTWYFAQCQPYFQMFALAKVAASKIFSTIEDQPVINLSKNNGKKFSYLQGKISFENVYFHYPSRQDVQILQGLTLTVNAGETVALVGSSGCGKSTCIQLIQRFYDALKGRVIIDGTEITDFDLTWLRNQIGVVGQEPILFGTTIRENIRYGNLEATNEEIIEAAKKANAHSFIKNLPLNYDTLVGEKGAQLSGGQKQRIAIARALVRNPSILLLDEATSALDTSSEAQVQQALDDASKERTTIIVAHRLSTIRHADKIFMLSEGRVLEEGSHEELMDNKGPYFNLVTAQVSKETETVKSNVIDSDSKKPQIELKENKKDILNNNNNEEITEEAADLKLSTLQTIGAMLKMNKPEYIHITLACIGAAIAGSSLPLYSIVFGDIIGLLSNPNDDKVRSEANTYSMYFGIIGVITSVSSFFQWYLFGRSGEKLTTRVRGKMFETMLNQEMGWYDRKENGTGAICSRLSGDASSVQGASGQSLGILANSISSLGLAVIISFTYNWSLTLVNLIFVPVTFIGVYFEQKFLSTNTLSDSNAVEESSKLAVEVISNIRTVASLGCETKFHSMYVGILNRSKSTFGTHIRGFVLGIARSMVCFSYAFSILYGGYLIKEEDLQYAIVFKVTEAIISGSWAVANTLAFSPDFQKGISASIKIIALFQRTPAIQDMESSQDLKWDKSAISYKQINFVYPTRSEIKVLDNLDLAIQHGKTIALVGPSGCGKSTIIQLLERFYDPNSGSVLIDNQNLKWVKLQSLRQHLGIVSQEPNLFDRTISENIAYGDNSRIVTQSEIIQAAKDANIHSFISKLPLGYETRLGEKGTQLSGGQKQRIAIARALVRNPQVLLLDEATSALDTESEKIVQEALDNAKSGRTCITIAHRLLTIKDADVICVINNGIIAEMGTHDELLRLNGVYQNLYNLQTRTN